MGRAHQDRARRRQTRWHQASPHQTWRFGEVAWMPAFHVGAGRSNRIEMLHIPPSAGCEAFRSSSHSQRQPNLGTSTPATTHFNPPIPQKPATSVDERLCRRTHFGLKILHLQILTRVRAEELDRSKCSLVVVFLEVNRVNVEDDPRIIDHFCVF